MISSMTGFGQATAQAEGVVYTVEIRSVNNRYFKTSIRLPDIASFLEDELDKFLRNLVHRGSVNFSLRMKNISGQAFVDIDEVSLSGYLEKLTGLLENTDSFRRIDLASMLSLPGIVQPKIPDPEILEQMRRAVMQCTQEAVDQLIQSRRSEGNALAEEFRAHCRRIAETLEKIRNRKDIVIQEYHEKLKKRVDNLLAQAKLKLDEDLLMREVAVYAERSDIAEELIRLRTHIDQFTECCSNGGPIGRRLDFVAQEMLREANTIASKASDAEIAQWVIDIKCEIDRIKEQVQNIE